MSAGRRPTRRPLSRHLVALALVAAPALPAVSQSAADAESAAAAELLESAEALFDEARGAVDYARLAAAEALLAEIWVAHPRVEQPGFAPRVAARLRHAELALQRGAYALAASSALAVLETEPAAAAARLAAWNLLARARLAENDLETAREALQSAVDEAGAADAEPVASELDRAARALTTIHRTLLRPASGESGWRETRTLAVSESLRRPAGVAARDDAVLAIVDQGRDELVLLGPGRAAARRRPLVKPHRPSWSRDDEALQARATFVDERGRGLKAVSRAVEGELGETYVLAAKPDPRVLVYRPNGRYLKSVALPAGVEPVDLARGPGHGVYLLAESGVYLHSPSDGNTVAVARRRFAAPEALAVDAIGNLYVLLADARKIEVLSAGGEPLATLGPTLPGGVALANPVDVAVDGAGVVFIAAIRPAAILRVE